MYKFKRKLGKDLVVGDIIKVWWNPGRPKYDHVDRIIELKPYKGNLEYLYPNGATIAFFAFNISGMTIDNDDVLEVVYNEI